MRFYFFLFLRYRTDSTVPLFRMAGTGSYFQTYLRRALANLETADRERNVDPPAPASPTPDACSYPPFFSPPALTDPLFFHSSPCFPHLPPFQHRYPDPFLPVVDGRRRRRHKHASAVRQALRAAVDVRLCGAEGVEGGFVVQ